MPGPTPFAAIVAVSKNAGVDNKILPLMVVAFAFVMLALVSINLFGVVRKSFAEALAKGEVVNSPKGKLLFALRYIVLIVGALVLTYYFGLAFISIASIGLLICVLVSVGKSNTR